LKTRSLCTEFDICSLLYHDFSTSIADIVDFILVVKQALEGPRFNLQNLWTKLQRR